ncbi:MAG TPA: hypothetical protein VFQ93_14525 [Casimicrobiaceae bacterium]|nr:hypothetical protein [Casimicrobiaceae bacterium]
MNLERYRRRRWMAALLAFALAFAQVAVAAYACPIADPMVTTPVSDARSMEPMSDCGPMPAQADPATNVCEAHCLVGQQVQSDSGMFTPVAVVPPLVIRVLPASLDARAAFVDADAPLPTPPPLLRFTRLLI